MKEIGGYFELETFHMPMLHEEALGLNCARSCISYLIEARNIRKIAIPYYLCYCVGAVCEKHGVKIRYYHTDRNFLPVDLSVAPDEWLYFMNYYGRIEPETIKEYALRYPNIIVDNAQAYFEKPIPHIDTIYTCRKFFGVSDGALLYSDVKLHREIPQDESFERMNFVLGRFERTASEFFKEAVENNEFYNGEPIRQMSKLTFNLLHAVDYAFAEKKRTENYNFLADHLDQLNLLPPVKVSGAFAYPLWLENGAEVRRKLIENKIYVPTLWPDVAEKMPCDSLEYDMSENILPLPVDQRYNEEDMKQIVSLINKIL